MSRATKPTSRACTMKPIAYSSSIRQRANVDYRPGSLVRDSASAGACRVVGGAASAAPAESLAGQRRRPSGAQPAQKLGHAHLGRLDARHELLILDRQAEATIVWRYQLKPLGPEVEENLATNKQTNINSLGKKFKRLSKPPKKRTSGAGKSLKIN